MDPTEPLIRNISDTARWVAVYRARETDRPDALFRDPFARRLAGKRGEEIAESVGLAKSPEWTWATRTYLFDHFVTEQVEQGCDMVVNLAAGLDARPYRMALPPSLQWVEVDLPELLAYKEEILAGEKPVCTLERIPLDLSQVDARRELFGRLAGRAKRVLILTEGLIIYLTAEEVGALAQNLAAPASFQCWVIDLASPGLLRMLQKHIGSPLSQAGAPLKFAPEEGPEFFTRYGWKPREVCSLLQTAGKLNRLSFWMRLLARFAGSPGRKGKRPWSGICLLGKA